MPVTKTPEQVFAVLRSVFNLLDKHIDSKLPGLESDGTGSCFSTIEVMTKKASWPGQVFETNLQDEAANTMFIVKGCLANAKAHQPDHIAVSGFVTDPKTGRFALDVAREFVVKNETPSAITAKIIKLVTDVRAMVNSHAKDMAAKSATAATETTAMAKFGPLLKLVQRAADETRRDVGNLSRETKNDLLDTLEKTIKDAGRAVFLPKLTHFLTIVDKYENGNGHTALVFNTKCNEFLHDFKTGKLLTAAKHTEVIKQMEEKRAKIRDSSRPEQKYGRFDARRYDPKVPDGGAAKSCFVPKLKSKDDGALLYSIKDLGSRTVSEGSNIMLDGKRIEKATGGKISRWQVVWSFFHNNENSFDSMWADCPGYRK